MSPSPVVNSPSESQPNTAIRTQIHQQRGMRRSIAECYGSVSRFGLDAGPEGFASGKPAAIPGSVPGLSSKGGGLLIANLSVAGPASEFIDRPEGTLRHIPLSAGLFGFLRGVLRANAPRREKSGAE